MDKHIAHVFPDDLEKLQNSECAVTVYSVAMGDPDRGETVPLVLADQLPPAPVAEELSGEPVAWMHDKDGRVDVIHKDVKKLLADWDATKQGTGEGYYRKLATVEHYTIPLYTHPQPAVDVDALANFIKNTYPISWEYGSHKLAEQICNWIEEQQQ